MDLVAQRRPPRPPTPPPTPRTSRTRSGARSDTGPVSLRRAADSPAPSEATQTAQAAQSGPALRAEAAARTAAADAVVRGASGASGAGGPAAGTPSRFRGGRGRRALVATALIAGLCGGVIGGWVTSLLSDRSAGDPAPTALAAPAPTVVDPGSVASVVARVLPSVVTIDVTAGTQGGNGSGVIIRADGYVLTNNHVIAPAANAAGQVMVTTTAGAEPILAEIVGRDPRSDLAVLRLPGASGLPVATLGRSGSLVAGAPVIAIGAPFGLAGTVTTGIVSALDRNPTVPAEGGGASVIIGAIQIDAAINPGNSGGPLLDAKGQVVGLNTAIATAPGAAGQSGSVGVGFAIPIDYASSVADEIIRTGRATHPYLGVSAATVTAAEARARGTVPGAIIRDIEPTGPASSAGLIPGDIILRVDDRTVTSTNDLNAATRLHRIGDTVTVTFWRNGAQTTTRVVLQEQPG
ncbi:trypsin-like peptidase domain-containing protein [Frankia sp. Cpl3]|nr:trypsin-like peptidase domain-containing protein [Frankia sp. Cpl3]